jgi:hypothetical protein
MVYHLMRHMPNATRALRSCRVLKSIKRDNLNWLLAPACKICVYVVIVALWVGVVIVM